jgi:hypothetical protein
MRHWIPEIHFVDRERRIGGLLEELLTVDNAWSGWVLRDRIPARNGSGVE